MGIIPTLVGNVGIVELLSMIANRVVRVLEMGTKICLNEVKT